MPRLFTGVELPGDVALQLSLLQGGVPGARWIDPQNFHITLRFAGDIDNPTAGELYAMLDDLDVTPFELRLSGLGVFGGRKPHSLHARVAASDSLMRLHVAHERLCRRVGLKPETRNFAPHVTLARLGAASRQAVQAFVAERETFTSRRFTVERFVVFSSRPSRGGGPYAIEQVYDLARVM